MASRKRLASVLEHWDEIAGGERSVNHVFGETGRAAARVKSRCRARATKASGGHSNPAVLSNHSRAATLRLSHYGEMS